VEKWFSLRQKYNMLHFSSGQTAKEVEAFLDSAAVNEYLLFTTFSILDQRAFKT
jgi:hypothetical protein